MPDPAVASPPLTGTVRRLVARFRREIHEMGKFGVVGAIAWVVDTLVFTTCLNANANRYAAAVISTAFSATVAFIGNRSWTWRDRARSSLRREYSLYAFFNVIGLFIGLSCLFISHEFLGAWQPGLFHSTFADTVAKNGVGLVLGTMFRFWAYRRYVFAATDTPAPTAAVATSD